MHASNYKLIIKIFIFLCWKNCPTYNYLVLREHNNNIQIYYHNLEHHKQPLLKKFQRIVFLQLFSIM